MQVGTTGIDLAKSVFQVHGVDAKDKTVLKKQLRRAQVIAFFSKMPPCLSIPLSQTAHSEGCTPGEASPQQLQIYRRASNSLRRLIEGLSLYYGGIARNITRPTLEQYLEDSRK